MIETYNWLKELEMVCAMVCRPPHPHSGWLVPVGNGTLGAVKSGIERRPERQGSISSGTRLGGATYKRHIFWCAFYVWIFSFCGDDLWWDRISNFDLSVGWATFTAVGLGLVSRHFIILNRLLTDSRGRLSLRLKSKNIIAYQGNTQHLRL